ncbi:MAG: hypothetical protein AAGK01_02415 [Pseudomonadota bacterium]
MIGAEPQKKRGGPLTMLVILAIAWIGGRVMLWESPFAAVPLNLSGASGLIAEAEPATPSSGTTDPVEAVDQTRENRTALAFLETERFAALQINMMRHASLYSEDRFSARDRASPYYTSPQVAAGHQLLWTAALAHIPMPRAVEDAWRSQAKQQPLAHANMIGSGDAPFLSLPSNTKKKRQDRWSLDAWSFWRQGSNADAISQGRVPIYGASQVGASARYRLAPSSANDPFLYGRAYQALVDDGETEFSVGVSARPVGRVPVRVFAELRHTENSFGAELRPAVFAVTELPSVALPVGLKGEAYGQAGYVGGDDPTPFADGQLVVSRDVAQFDLSSASSAKFSVGAGAWGGAQKDATRLDLGPTVRLDLTIGSVPARVSVDWREQVAGDAAPDSGVAATLSTRF